MSFLDLEDGTSGTYQQTGRLGATSAPRSTWGDSGKSSSFLCICAKNPSLGGTSSGYGTLGGHSTFNAGATSGGNKDQFTKIHNTVFKDLEDFARNVTAIQRMHQNLGTPRDSEDLRNEM